MFDKKTPWNDIPILPPASDIESKNILKACISAMTELAKVNALMKTLPNETVLVHTLPLQEARRSSEIENIVTTNDELYRAMTSEKIQITPHTKEVIRYREALWTGIDNMRKRPIINMSLFEEICTRILDIQMSVRKYEVKIQNPITKEIIYTPPTGHENIIRLLTNLENFINDEKDEVEPLVKMAIMHYQFEAIHPFTDGNGRTGRILNILYLMHQKLLDVPILYLSRYFIEKRTEYYRYLRKVTEYGNWEQWILYVLSAVEQTSREVANIIKEINTLIDKINTQAQDKTLAVKREGFVDLLFKWPYCKINIVERELNCSRVTASKYLNEMADIGLLEHIKIGRESYYINTDLMNLLSNV